MINDICLLRIFYIDAKAPADNRAHSIQYFRRLESDGFENTLF